MGQTKKGGLRWSCCLSTWCSWQSWWARKVLHHPWLVLQGEGTLLHEQQDQSKQLLYKMDYGSHGHGSDKCSFLLLLFFHRLFAVTTFWWRFLSALALARAIRDLYNQSYMWHSCILSYSAPLQNIVLPSVHSFNITWCTIYSPLLAPTGSPVSLFIIFISTRLLPLLWAFRVPTLILPLPIVPYLSSKTTAFCDVKLRAVSTWAIASFSVPRMHTTISESLLTQ
jgi:hypothetical protein